MIPGVVVSLLLGVLTWSLLEYLIHRYLGHDRRYRKNVFAREHIRHHIEGDYFAPTHKKAQAAALAAALVTPFAILAAGPARGGAYVTGLMLFYTAYEILHRREHTSAGFGAYGRWARRHHFYHHFENAKMNHGVTSPLWDIVFGTYRAPGVIHVPPKLCMTWLRDPRTGDVRTEHAASFALESSARTAEKDVETVSSSFSHPPQESV